MKNGFHHPIAQVHRMVYSANSKLLENSMIIVNNSTCINYFDVNESYNIMGHGKKVGSSKKANIIDGTKNLDTSG